MRLVILNNRLLFFHLILNAVINLPADFVLLGIKDKVGLSERPLHPADILLSFFIVFPLFVTDNKLILELNKEFDFLGMSVDLLIVKLNLLGVLKEPLLVLSLRDLVLERAFLIILLPPVPVSLERVLQFIFQEWDDQIEMGVNDNLNISNPLFQESLVG